MRFDEKLFQYVLEASKEFENGFDHLCHYPFISKEKSDLLIQDSKNCSFSMTGLDLTLVMSTQQLDTKCQEQ